MPRIMNMFGFRIMNMSGLVSIQSVCWWFRQFLGSFSQKIQKCMRKFIPNCHPKHVITSPNDGAGYINF